MQKIISVMVKVYFVGQWTIKKNGIDAVFFYDKSK